MGNLGARNPLPMHLGGNPSPTEAVWRALRAAMGTTASGKPTAGPVDGIEDSWRVSKARILARGQQLVELAALQAFPHVATVSLPVYQASLNVQPQPTEQQDREACTAALVAKTDGVAYHVEIALQRIDPAITLQYVPFDQAVVEELGQMLREMSVPLLWSKPETSWPCYSDAFFCVVSWPGSPSQSEIASAAQILHESLPAWQDWAIVDSTDGGFFCSHSLLGLDAL